MSVECSSVAGIGIRITDQHLSDAGYKKKSCDGCVADCDECDEDVPVEDFLEDFGVSFATYGSYYTGKTKNAWLVPGEKYLEIVKNVPGFWNL